MKGPRYKAIASVRSCAALALVVTGISSGAHQKLLGLYLLPTITMAILESDSIG